MVNVIATVASERCPMCGNVIPNLLSRFHAPVTLVICQKCGAQINFYENTIGASIAWRNKKRVSKGEYKK